MASLYTKDLLPSTSEAALREFDERYLAAATAASDAGSWAAQFTESTGAPRVTYPMSYFTAKFNETKFQPGQFKGFEEKSFDVKVVEYDGGHEASVLELMNNVFRYRRWQEAPAAMVAAEQWFAAEKLVALLEAGASTASPFDDVNFFSATHRSNPFDGVAGNTWSNYQSATKDPASITNLTVEMTLMKDVRDLNHKKMGVMPDEIWVPSEKAMAVSNLLNQANLATGESNPLAGKLRVVEIPQLTDVNDWFLVDSRLMKQMPALIAAKFQPADSLGIRTFDESSDYFKDTGRIKKSVHIWYGFGLVFPHAIRLVKGA